MSRSILIPTLAALGIAGMVATAASAAAADNFDLQFHGFASQGYLKTYDHESFGRDTDSGSFEFNEFAFNVMATPIERVRVAVQIISYDLGKYGNNSLLIDWAFGEYQAPTGVNWLDVNLVAGRFKTGHGLYNDFRDLDMTRTSVFLPESVYSSTFRDFFLAANGGQLNTTARAGALGSFNVSGFIGTQNLDETQGAMLDGFKNGIARTSPTIPGVGTIALQLESVSALTLERFNGGYVTWNTPVRGLRLKASNLYAKDLHASGATLRATLPASVGSASTTTDIDILVTHWFDILSGCEYQTGNWTFATEWSNQFYKGQIDTGALNFSPLGPTPFDSPASRQIVTSRTLAGYVSANYQLSALPGAWSRCQLFAAGNWQREVFNSVKSYTRSAVAAMRYDVTDHLLIKAEFQRYQDTNAANVHTYGNLFALKSTFDF